MVDSKQVRLALRDLRTTKNLTPEEFADAGGVGRATVYRIEDFTAEYSPKIETICALVEGVDLRLAEFFIGLEDLRWQTPVGKELAPARTDASADDHTSDADVIARFVGAVDRWIAARVPQLVAPNVEPARVIVLPPTFPLEKKSAVVVFAESLTKNAAVDEESVAPAPRRSAQSSRSREAVGQLKKGR